MRLKSEAELNKLLKNSHAKVRNSIRSQTPHVEQDPFDEAKRAYEIKAFDSPVIITVHSFRYRRADPEGLCFKHHLDCIVKAGILVDDSCEYVEEVRFKQTKIKKPEEERTVISIQSIS
jgi:hypothetical protein